MSALVPIDLSEVSAAAVELAVNLCRAAGVQEVQVLHASAGRSELAVLARLYDLTEPLRAAGLRARVRTVADDAVSAIRRAAAAPACSFVVMGVCGADGGGLDAAGGPGRRTGRVAASILASCPAPVAAVWQPMPAADAPAQLVELLEPDGTTSAAAASLGELVSRALGPAHTRHRCGPAEAEPLLRRCAGPLVVIGGAR